MTKKTDEGSEGAVGDMTVRGCFSFSGGSPGVLSRGFARCVGFVSLHHHILDYGSPFLPITGQRVYLGVSDVGSH